MRKITNTSEKLAKIREAQEIRMHSFDTIGLSLARGELKPDEAVKWIDLILRCRSLDDIRKLKEIIATVTRIDL
jgi:hypothetical protein